jgi:hypothetical protein
MYRGVEGRPFSASLCLILAVCAVALTWTGCVAGEPGSYPLYPLTDGPLPPGKVARLVGYVKYVDGQSVSDHGSSFDVLPGCHLVGTPSTWGQPNGLSGRVVYATTGRLTFALPMKAGYQYEIRVEDTLRIRLTVRVVSHETNARGETTRTFSPAKSARDIELCRREFPAPALTREPEIEQGPAERAVEPREDGQRDASPP